MLNTMERNTPSEPLEPQPEATDEQVEPQGKPEVEAEPSPGSSRVLPHRVTRAMRRLLRGVPEPDIPEHPLSGEENPQFEPLSALHPIAIGFLGTLGVGIALGGFYLLTNVGQLVTWISVALFIALGLDPVVRFLMRRGLGRPAAVVVTMVGLFALFGGFMALIIPMLITQITQFIDDAPEIVSNFVNSEWVHNLDNQFGLSERVTTEVDKFFGDSGAVTQLFGGVLGVSQTVAQSMFGVLIVLVLAVYFLASLPSINHFALRLAPNSKRKRVDQLLTRITRSVGNYVMGQASVAGLNALVAMTLMLVLGVPFAALLTAAVAVLAFIPMVGAVIAGVLVTLVSFSLGWQSALVYALCYFGYLQVESYVLAPRIMNRAVSVPGAVAVISVIAGGTLMGITGALMAIPVAASAMMLVQEIFIARQDRR